MQKAIDISEYQRNVDWGKVSKNIDYILLRSGYGYSTEDKMFMSHVAGAKANDLPIKGIYHFSYSLTPADAIIEAEFAIKMFEKAKLNKEETIIFFDYEYDSRDYAKKNGVTINSDNVVDITKSFCDVLKAKGYKYGVYCNNDYYINFYKNGSGIPAGAYLWFADYRTNPNKSVVDKCYIYQFSSKYKVDGIDGGVDGDYIMTEDKTTAPAPTKPEKPVEKKSVDELAKEVISGKWGNGDERKKKLTDAGYNYSEVQSKVNEMLKPKTKPVTDEIVADVIAGKYGNGEDRKKRLENAGYIYRDVQDAVNKKLENKNKAVSPAKSFDNSYTGKYKVTANALNLRYIPGLMTDNNVVRVLKHNEVIQNWGYYTDANGSTWLLVQVGSITGYVDKRFVVRY